MRRVLQAAVLAAGAVVGWVLTAPVPRRFHYRTFECYRCGPGTVRVVPSLVSVEPWRGGWRARTMCTGCGRPLVGFADGRTAAALVKLGARVSRVPQ